MNPILTERLLTIAQAAEKAGHGGKDAVYQKGCQALGISKATLLRKIKQVSYKPPRKQRVDYGTSALTRDEALLISGVMMASPRKNGKRLYSLEQAVNDLRANNLINAGYIDNETGEWFPLSVDAISRALYRYRLHPNQLGASAPCVQLKTDHPNHVWQLDASLCVLYYLKNPDKGRTTRDRGLRMMSEAEFNKNKPKNLARIVNDRVWSFELTDHTSGWIYAEYRFGGETAQNFTDVLINAMQERSGADVLHGVPRILYTDPGCALVSATMRNLCKTLGIQLIAHKAGNARATGSVEKARDILECNFESGLRFVQVDNIDELNRRIGLWRKKYNRTALHRRTGMTRTDSWLRITPQQLIKAPPVDVCRELAVSLPENRKVNKYLRVSFGGKEYDVRGVPGVCNNDWLQIVRNPWRDSEAQVVMMNEDGMEVFYRIPEVVKDEYGFPLNAPTLGESFKALPHTKAQHHLAEVEQTMYGTTCPTETAAAQKAKALPIPTLKHLKRFFELDDGHKKLLSIVLLGQPELGDKLSERLLDVREVVQRCEVIDLPPLDAHLADFLAFKFKRIGADLNKIITPEAIKAIRQRLSYQRGGQSVPYQQRTTVSLLYPLAIGNLLTAAMNLAAQNVIPVIDANIIHSVH